MSSSHLLIIGDRAALSCVVTEQRMAFPAGGTKVARMLEEGDEIFLCTTRGCFRNPTRPLGRVIARASLTTPVRALDEPVVFGDAIVLRDLVPRLSVFPDPATWSVRRRRASLTLPPGDADLIRGGLEPLLRPYGEAADAYRWESASA
ncbi:hypothetical protein ACFTZ8_18560 [Streptomyces fungicidicus]|uniref:hypothetical protein n=1 Tax=Streptomyces fungicidicus TaxID=68203 RepID=UPI0036449510